MTWPSFDELVSWLERLRATIVRPGITLTFPAADLVHDTACVDSILAVLRRARHRDLTAECVCDPEEWGGIENTPPICAAYEADPDGFCKHCGHEDDCHRTLGGNTAPPECAT